MDDLAHEHETDSSGYIDIHSHMLPGVDDGCRTLSESIQCVKAMMQRGYVGSICTPHMIGHTFPDNTPTRVDERVDELRNELAKRNLDYTLWSGGELQINEQTLPWIAEVGLQPLGDSRCVLVDTWVRAWGGITDQVIDFIQQQDCRVILAHPERLPIDDLDTLLPELQQRGIWLQGNFNSVAGFEGPQARRVALKLLREDRYRFMAMDMHRPDSLDTRFEGLTATEMAVGPEKLADLIRENPLRMLAGENV